MPAPVLIKQSSSKYPNISGRAKLWGDAFCCMQTTSLPVPPEPYYVTSCGQPQCSMFVYVAYHASAVRLRAAHALSERGA